MASQTVSMSSNQNINGILAGVRWSGTVMTYGFPTAADQYSGYPWNFNYDHDNNPVTPNITVSVNETTGFVALNAIQQDAATAAFRNFAGVTNMSALEQQPANSADVRLAMSNSRDPTSTTAYNFYPGDDRNGDGWFNTTAYNSPRLGTYAYQTFFHEIGHGLGLKHGHEAANGNSNLVSSDRDSLEFTTMTYRSFIGSGTGSYSVAGGHYPQTYMMLDIAALQYMYGADFTNNDGNTTYRFDPSTGEMFIGSFGQGVPQNNAGVNVNIIFRTIWDGNGIDTYDFSAYGSNRQLVVDLVPGGWTDVDSDSNFQAADLNNGAPGTQIARGQVFNSLLFNGDTRSLIENVIGGAGNDWIKGNQAGNHLQGRDGDDTLEGFDGSDVLDQGEGGGSMYGGNGNDILWAGPGAEIIDGGNDFDAVNYSRSTSYILIDTTIGKVTGGWAIDDTLIGIEQIVATGYDDSIAMGSETNTIYAGNGADSLDGGDGPDQLFGEAGDDILRGGVGGDLISGGAGYDIATFAEAVTINLQTGARSGEAIGDSYDSIEQYNGSSYSDTLVASNSQGARFAGGDGVDYLYGLDREDWLQGGKGADYISGGNGFDMVSYADAPYGITAEMYFDADTALGHTEGKITAGEWGLDTLVSIEDVEGSAYGDVLLGDERSNKLSGLGGDDRIEGDGGTTPQGSSDILLGGTGNDSILIGASDFAYGGPDSDTATFVGGAIYISFNTNTFTVGGQGFYIAEFETYIGTGFGDTFFGAASGETIDLGAGNDFLYGQGGNDFLYIGPGTDVMAGGDGYDTMVFNKTMVADWQSGVLDADIGADSWSNWEAIQGSSGNDRIRTNSWGFSVELRGGAGNDVLATGVTGVVSDILQGEDGDDELNGGGGDDFLYGQNGNDTLFCAPGADYMDCGDGYDIIAFHKAMVADWQSGVLDADIGADIWSNWEAIQGSVDDDIIRTNSWGYSVELRGGAGNDTLATGVSGIVSDILLGEDGDDHLDGGAGNDVLNGGIGADTLVGGAGNDTYIVDDAGDVATELSGAGTDLVKSSIDYTVTSFVEKLTLTGTAIKGTGNSLNNIITGNAKSNILSGNAGKDTLYGLGGNDVINGGNGDDLLTGGAGKDKLSGGAGADTFWYNAAPGATNKDTITGFVSGTDKLQFSSSVLSELGLTGQFGVADDRFWSDTTGDPHDATDRLIYKSTSGELFYDSDGIVGGSILIELVATAPALNAIDIWVV